MNTDLKRRSKKITYSNWKKWNPVEYLNTYFSTLRRDEDETLEFLVKSVKKLSNRGKMRVLEFGTGPTVVHGIVISNIATEIHFSDYLKQNLSEVKKWLTSKNNAFDWSLFTRRIIQLENKKVTDKVVNLRHKELRKKVKKLLLSDAALDFPLKAKVDTYDLVIMTYCVDSATASKKVWRTYMKNVLTLVAPKGTILITALRKCKFYTVGDERFPSANITENDLRDVLLKNGFRVGKSDIQVKEVPECAEEGYSGLVFASATRK